MIYESQMKKHKNRKCLTMNGVMFHELSFLRKVLFLWLMKPREKTIFLYQHTPEEMCRCTSHRGPVKGLTCAVVCGNFFAKRMRKDK